MNDTHFATDRPAPRTGTKRAAILDAAKRAFVRDGVGAVSIDAIAIEAGVSRQTVYNQLGDKDQLLVAVIEDVTRPLERATDGRGRHLPRQAR